MALPDWRTADIVFEGVNLNRNLEWTDKDSWSPIAMQSRRLLGGANVHYYQQLDGGRPITLQASATRGWLTKDEKDHIDSLSIQLGGQFTLVWFGETYQVIFDHTQGPSVQLSPLRAQQQPGPSDYFIGTVRLLTV